jgi:PAS domain-containing protein
MPRNRGLDSANVAESRVGADSRPRPPDVDAKLPAACLTAALAGAAPGNHLTDNPAVPLIVFSPQREPSEFINSLMRKAGEPVHCTWIPAVRDLGEALEQLNPELLVCAYVSDADAKQAATVRDQLAPQVPMLLVRPQISEGDIANGMRIGARDVISLSASDRVQAVVARELRSFRLERALNTTLQSASDYRRQLQSVLQRSNDAILQVQEGIVVDANQTWLELFGYAEDGAIVGQPLMDLFEDRSHAALKGALVACAASCRWTWCSPRGNSRTTLACASWFRPASATSVS